MTGIVVEVGPATVRGPNLVDAEWVSAGIDGIDDELTLIDDGVVAVADVWRTVIHDAVAGVAETIVVVCPTWWASSRVERVREAASAVADDVVVRRRAQALRDGLPDRLLTVLEIAPEFVVVSSPEGDLDVVRRGDAEAVAARVPTSMRVLLDCPDGVEGGHPLAAMIADRLRASGVAVTIADRDCLRRGAAALSAREEDLVADGRPSRHRRRATAVLTGALLSAAVLCGGFAAGHDDGPSNTAVPTTLLVEGRVGVMVPAQWVVQRITSGPGSARLQVLSPIDGDIAVHITQSLLAPVPSPEQMAESLRSALGDQPEGVFVEFDPADRRAGRPVVSYREIRADHHIAWVVFVDESLRIAIGCQSAPGHEEAVRDACDQAIRSAHAVF
jgi:type VII secretion-associated protein (TIGR03931 family)